MAKASPEQAKAGMDAWMAWAKKARSAIVDLGSPLGHPTKVDSSSGARSDRSVSGYSILQAESSTALQDLSQQSSAPHGARCRDRDFRVCTDAHRGLIPFTFGLRRAPPAARRLQ